MNVPTSIRLPFIVRVVKPVPGLTVRGVVYDALLMKKSTTSPAAMVGTVKLVAPLARAETKSEVGVIRTPPSVTLKVVAPVCPNPKPVKETTVPVGPLAGESNKAVMAIVNPIVAFKPFVSVALMK